VRAGSRGPAGRAARLAQERFELSRAAAHGADVDQVGDGAVAPDLDDLPGAAGGPADQGGVRDGDLQPREEPAPPDPGRRHHRPGDEDGVAAHGRTLEAVGADPHPRRSLPLQQDDAGAADGGPGQVAERLGPEELQSGGQGERPPGQQPGDRGHHAIGGHDDAGDHGQVSRREAACRPGEGGQ